jgi:hypothetical protein
VRVRAARGWTVLWLGMAASVSAQTSPASDALQCESVVRRTVAPADRAAVERRSAARPELPLASFLRGCLLMGEGRFNKAADQFERASAREAR